MTAYRILSTLALTAQFALHAAEPASGQAPLAVSPVLRKLEPDDSRQVTLPAGRRAPAPAPAPANRKAAAKRSVPAPAAPPPEPAPAAVQAAVPPRPVYGPPVAPEPAEAPAKVEAAAVAEPAPVVASQPETPAAGPAEPPAKPEFPALAATPVDEPAPVHSEPPSKLERPAAPVFGPPVAEPAAPAAVPAPQEPPAPAAPRLPADFLAESALFLQEKIGQFGLESAKSLLGEPVRSRAAVDDNQAENGRIYAFEDPSGRYRELELDFDKYSGNLRTVFVYPRQMTWQECRQLFTGDVNTAKGNKGRTFYSFINRRLDVLVDAAGQVISLGLY